MRKSKYTAEQRGHMAARFVAARDRAAFAQRVGVPFGTLAGWAAKARREEPARRAAGPAGKVGRPAPAVPEVVVGPPSPLSELALVFIGRLGPLHVAALIDLPADLLARVPAQGEPLEGREVATAN